ncbi:MAG: hypothetical protein ACJ8D1_16745, partial [Microvirga sp.]
MTDETDDRLPDPANLVTKLRELLLQNLCVHFRGRQGAVANLRGQLHLPPGLRPLGDDQHHDGQQKIGKCDHGSTAALILVKERPSFWEEGRKKATGHIALHQRYCASQHHPHMSVSFEITPYLKGPVIMQRLGQMIRQLAHYRHQWETVMDKSSAASAAFDSPS